ncbi:MULTISPECIES: recombinase family protein [Kordiimonas]|jgi:DNA invertase Pin-like site-specific DNA recombinase|uniref:recombinase family protein n=1 Tax=Kordiimonas TaxID=288021 RepID=UPI00257F9D65|nr:recombinase family protein [Kordiimonas sp. UBA4487]
MPSVAFYARYSSDHQRDASIEDQLRLCRERAEREGWHVTDSYSDRSVSGASLMRPGIQALMRDALAGRFDIVLAESLDRISRDQEDIAGVYKRLSFAGVCMVTLSEGDINELHIGLKGTMGALYLKDLADKTRRGLRGRIEAGKSGGGNSYGYRVVRKLDPAGEPVRGEREIDPVEAAIVKRIFTDYADGKSPRTIAMELNAKNVPCPRGKGWGPSTINGNLSRGTGILNNELYIGRLVWNRLRYIKDPDTGKRVSRMNPEEDWIAQEVPELRIIEDALWQKVKERQNKVRTRYLAKTPRNKLTAMKRPKYLFSGMIRCGQCGGGFTIAYRQMYGCASVKNKGTCSNHMTVSREDLERRVLDALKSQLMLPDLFEDFCEAYRQEVNRLRMEATAEIAGKRAELQKVTRQIEQMIDAIQEGLYEPSMKVRMRSLEDRKANLTRELETAEEPPILLHPAMAEEYRKRVSKLYAMLTDERTRLEASDDIRALVGQITVMPAGDDPDGPPETGPQLWLEGDLAGILKLAADKKTPAHHIDERVLPTLVAGVGNSRSRQKEKSGPGGTALGASADVLPSMVAGARSHLDLRK